MIVIFSKIVALVLMMFAVSRSITDYRSKKESGIMALFWIIVWVGISVLAVYPILLEKFINLLGGSRTGIGTIFGLTVVFIMFINYRVYLKAHRIEHQLRKIATRIGLKNLQ